MQVTQPDGVAVSDVQGCLALPDWGVLSAEGPDAASFLHAQLTQDIVHLDSQHARLAAWCTPKGRMLMSAVVWRPEPQRCLLAMPASRLEPVRKRLAMFVLRAKVQLHDASNEWAVHGAVGAALPAALAVPNWSAHADDAGRLWARLPPGAGVPRALLLRPAAANPPPCAALSTDWWAWLQVMSAVPFVTEPTVEAFVPQMLNYESVEGVHFQKGCYPGQEVVARSQFRGTLKRRGALLRVDGPVEVGHEVYHPSDPEQPAGLVADAAPQPGGQGVWHAVASLQTAAMDGQPLRIGSPQGPLAHLLPLPYPLRDDL
ncbi:YgfZ/GcvT domain-containing protein [Tepidimonas aquatica]|uniref:tRNA-modifying protein YgfZ n=1 Tax=Tepidimonas aquatica TaxID=247482 RepID=A0A554W9L4_9BURK|nr:folate-binding protein YgfZ [Tepidimonas aquatica]TSE20268.1 tRNA-modifying protein YgfZ [Tepidimonas aquatica]